LAEKFFVKLNYIIVPHQYLQSSATGDWNNMMLPYGN